MKRFSLAAVLAASLSLAFVSAAPAEPVTFEIDRAHSEVGFNVRHFFSRVHGRFEDYTATIVYDAANLAASSVEVVIRDSSINTQNERRDNHLRTQDFFWAEKYPHITFKSTQVIPGKEPDRFQVQGNLTIRDVTQPVVLDVELLGMGAVAIGGNDMGTRAGFEARTEIDRKDFGIVWNKTLDQGGVLLGDDVEIVISLEVKAKPPVAAATGMKVD